MTTSRRVLTTIVGVGLAGTALASTGPAAFAAKDHSAQPLKRVYALGYGDGGLDRVEVRYEVPEVPKAIKTVTCTLDGVALADCGVLQTPTRESSSYYIRDFVQATGASAGVHTFAVTVTATGKATYVGATTFTLAL